MGVVASVQLSNTVTLRVGSFSIGVNQVMLTSGRGSSHLVDIRRTLHLRLFGGSLDLVFLCEVGVDNEGPLPAGIGVDSFYDAKHYNAAVGKSGVVLWRSANGYCSGRWLVVGILHVGTPMGVEVVCDEVNDCRDGYANG